MSGQEVHLTNPLQSGENHIGQVGSHAKLLDITLVLDAGNVYADGDVLAITAVVPNVMRVNGGTATLIGISILDEDKQAGAFDLLIFPTMVNVGTINAPYDITDEEARSIQAHIAIAATDYATWSNFSTAFLAPGDPGFRARILRAEANSKDMSISAISRSTKTYTAGGLKLKLHLLQD